MLKIKKFDSFFYIARFQDNQDYVEGKKKKNKTKTKPPTVKQNKQNDTNLMTAQNWKKYHPTKAILIYKSRVNSSFMSC